MQLTSTSSSIHPLTQEDKSEHHSQDIYAVLNRKNSLKQKCQLYNMSIKKRVFYIQWWPKLLEHQYFHQLKNGFKSVISIFCCSVSVGNNSLHFQTFILPLIVIISEIFVCTRSLTTASAPHRSDLIIIQSVWNDMKKFLFYFTTIQCEYIYTHTVWTQKAQNILRINKNIKYLYNNVY